ncbi:MAG: carbohydrate kinase [Bacteroidota bacterium]
MNETDTRVFCIGETVLDIIFSENQPVAAKPGGSMLNSSVSLGRAGVRVDFISALGNDHAGDLVMDFLAENHVSTGGILRYHDWNTSLALAFLDKQRNAEYTFYKEFPGDERWFSPPATAQGDIILFGSFFALTERIREPILSFIRQARRSGAFIIYDPNFRRSHLAGLEKTRPMIIENIAVADLVRGSDEDFQHIFSANTALEAYRHLAEAGCPSLVYTKNKAGVEWISPLGHHVAAVPQIDPVSTIGAGDAFNAGIIHALLQEKGNPSSFNPDHILRTAIKFSENVCMSMDNYISAEFAGTLRTKR